MSNLRTLAVVLIAFPMWACAGATRGARQEVLEPATGPLRVVIAYPKVSDTTTSVGDTVIYHAASDQVFPEVDSVFVFGTAGTAEADLTVNGYEVDVYPTGGWIAWVPLPPDTVAEFKIQAISGSDTVYAALRVPVAASFEPPEESKAWVDTTAFSPVGDVWTASEEGYRLSVRASPASSVELIFPDGRAVPLLEDPAQAAAAPGELAFGTDPEVENPVSGTGLYALWWQGEFGPDPGNLFFPNDTTLAADSEWVQVRAVADGDTASVRWPLRLRELGDFPPLVAVVTDDSAGVGDTDGLVPGRPSPWGTYHWFFPNGTMSRVSGRIGGQVRLQLSASTVAWVGSGDVVPLPPGTPPPVGTTHPVRLYHSDEFVRLRVPLEHRIPYLIEEEESVIRVTLYGVAADMDWMQYGETDSYVRRMSFAQPRSDEVELRIELPTPVWGYRSSWDGTTLRVDIRRSPVIDEGNALQGLVVAIDAGHPPAGATGPTLTGEWDVTLGVARAARAILEDRGAVVVLTRDTDAPLGLSERVKIAEEAGAHILVSIHANALPDGLNPFVNNGTSVYYNRARSEPLARALNRALVDEFGYPDLGFGRADLALTRSTWMPSALTEGLFMMLPDQEAILRSPQGQHDYAEAVAEGIEAFLEGWRARLERMTNR